MDSFEYEYVNAGGICGIGNISAQKIKTNLLPVLRRTERFNLPAAKVQVEEYLKAILLPEDNLSFWIYFAKGKYKPELLFGDYEILSMVTEHPMARWKCGRKSIE